MTWKLGDKFTMQWDNGEKSPTGHTVDTYIIAFHSHNAVSLVNIETGRHFKNYIKVKNVNSITESEMEMMLTTFIGTWTGPNWPPPASAILTFQEQQMDCDFSNKGWVDLSFDDNTGSSSRATYKLGKETIEEIRKFVSVTGPTIYGHEPIMRDNTCEYSIGCKIFSEQDIKAFLAMWDKHNS